MTTTDNISIINKKKSKPRCGHDECRKKLSLAEQSCICKCKKTFCGLHRLPENHFCNYNFSESAETKQLKTQALKCVGDKMIKI